MLVRVRSLRVSAALRTRVSLRPGKWRFDHIYPFVRLKFITFQMCTHITDTLRSPWSFQLRENCHSTRRRVVARRPVGFVAQVARITLGA